MSITPLTVYLVMQADVFLGALIGLGIVLTVLALIVASGKLILDEEDAKRLAEYPTKTGAAFAFVCFFLYAVIPSTKTLAAMLIVPAIANSEVIQKDMPELYNLAVEKLKDTLKE